MVFKADSPTVMLQLVRISNTEEECQGYLQTPKCLKGNLNLVGRESIRKRKEGCFPKIFSLKVLHETGLNITLNMLHVVFPLALLFALLIKPVK